MKKGDLFLFFSFLLIIGAMFIFAYYHYTERVNECTSDPLKFAVEKIRFNYEADHVSGNMVFYKDGVEKRWYFGDPSRINISK